MAPFRKVQRIAGAGSGERSGPGTAAGVKPTLGPGEMPSRSLVATRAPQLARHAPLVPAPARLETARSVSALRGPTQSEGSYFPDC